MRCFLNSQEPVHQAFDAFFVKYILIVGQFLSYGINSYAYRLVIPAIIISLIVLSLNLFGDGLRDAFDPKLRR